MAAPCGKLWAPVLRSSHSARQLKLARNSSPSICGPTNGFRLLYRPIDRLGFAVISHKREMAFLAEVLPPPILTDCVCDLREPCPVFGLLQDFRCAEVLDAVWLWIA